MASLLQKNITEEQPGEKDAQGKVCGKGARNFCILSGSPLSQHLKCSPAQKLFEPCPVFPGASSWRHDGSLTPSPAPLLFLEDGGGAGSSKPRVSLLFQGATPILKPSTKSCCLKTKDSHLEIQGILGICVRSQGQKPCVFHDLRDRRGDQRNSL